MENNQKENLVKILIVDDVESNRFILKDIIKELGHQPVLTENGAQALKMASKIKPELIVLDVAMPGMDGYEVCNKLKEDVELREIPVIFVSAHDKPDDMVRGFTVGGKDYITKPFVPEVVKARVELQLNLYETSRRMTEMNRQMRVLVEEQIERIEKERNKILYALMHVARENACYDDKYVERLTYNCRTLSEAMQLSTIFESKISDSFVDLIELTAPLCDLGNMAVPTSILQKQGILTEEEIIMMRKHTVIGSRILEDVKDVSNDSKQICMAVKIARHHHENWDGSGYPDGLVGDEIPLEAQIVSSVMSFCALTENRSYREAFTSDEAMEIMEKDAGKKFNPEIIFVMKKIAKRLQ